MKTSVRKASIEPGVVQRVARVTVAKHAPESATAVIPDWLHVLSIVSLALGAVCALVIAWDLRRHPQHMWIMNVVWPVTALFGSVLALWGYYSYGRLAAHEKAHPAMERGEEMPHSYPVNWWLIRRGIKEAM